MYILACSVHLHLQIYSIKMERSYCYMGGANSFHASEFSCILATAFVLQLNQFCSICPIWPLLDSRYGKKVSIHSAGPTSFGFKKLVHSRPLFLYVRLFKAVYNTVERQYMNKIADDWIRTADLTNCATTTASNGKATFIHNSKILHSCC